MHFQPFGQDSLSGVPLVVLGFMLVAVAGSGATFTLEAYDKTVLTEHPSTTGKIETPLLTENQILDDLTGKSGKPTLITLPEPEVIAPKTIVSVQDAVKTTLQNKIIEALRSSRVTVELNGTMDLDGNLTVPNVEFSFTNVPNPADKPAIPTKKKDDELHAPRMS